MTPTTPTNQAAPAAAVPPAQPVPLPPKPTAAEPLINLDAKRDNTDHMIHIAALHAACVAAVLFLFGYVETRVADIIPWWLYVVIGISFTIMWLNEDLVKERLKYVRLFLHNGSRKLPGEGGRPKDYFGGEGNLFKFSLGPWDLISFKDVDVSRRTFEFPEPIGQQLGALEAVITGDTSTQGKIKFAQMGVFFSEFFLSFDAQVTDPAFVNYEEGPPPNEVRDSQALNQVRLTILGLIRDVAMFMEDVLDPNIISPVVKNGFSVLDRRKTVEDLVWILLNKPEAQERILKTGITVWSITLRKIVADEDIVHAGEEVSEVELQGRAQKNLAANFADMIKVISDGMAGMTTGGKQRKPDTMQTLASAALAYFASREAIYLNKSSNTQTADKPKKP